MIGPALTGAAALFRLAPLLCSVICIVLRLQGVAAEVLTGAAAGCTGHLKAETGSYGSAIMVLACVTFVAACLVFVFPMAGQPDDARTALPQTASNMFLSAKLSRFRDSMAHADKSDMISTAISGIRKGAE